MHHSPAQRPPLPVPVPRMRTSSSQTIFKRAQRGLFAGETIRFGDRVSEHGNRSRRSWKPNVQRVPLWSETLRERLRVNVTTTALGLIDKSGGLDNYLISQRIPESLLAAKLRLRILMERLRKERLESRADSAAFNAA